jgi:ribose 5-phosphate isomerase B
MHIYLASDHAGIFLKEFVKNYLEKKGYIVKDFSNPKYDEGDDYPDFIFPCVEAYKKEINSDFKRGVCMIFGGSGTGEAICANRVRGMRAVVCNSNDLEIIKYGRLHNNANILSFGARFVKEEFALKAIEVFLQTSFEGGKHSRRIFKLDSFV